MVVPPVEKRDWCFSRLHGTLGGGTNSVPPKYFFADRLFFAFPNAGEESGDFSF